MLISSLHCPRLAIFQCKSIFCVNGPWYCLTAVTHIPDQTESHQRIYIKLNQAHSLYMMHDPTGATEHFTGMPTLITWGPFGWKKSIFRKCSMSLTFLLWYSLSFFVPPPPWVMSCGHNGRYSSVRPLLQAVAFKHDMSHHHPKMHLAEWLLMMSLWGPDRRRCCTTPFPEF